MNQDIIDLLLAYGFEDIGPQKNLVMISYKKDDIRLNIYFTTMTVTVDSPRGFHGTYRHIDLLGMENILQKYA